MITQHAILPPSSTISEDSDAERDMDTTRVYFGPFRTPERRFATIVAIPDPEPDSIPLPSSHDAAEKTRPRSRSLSTPTSTGSDEIMDVERLVGLGEELEEGGSGTQIATPQAGGFPDDDEPSSALASRLLRALDNPSPPPSPTLLPMVGGAHETDAIGEDGLEESVTALVASTSSPLPSEHQIVPPPSIPVVTNDPDLMTFDSFDDRMEPATLLFQQGNAVQTPPSPFSFPDTIAPSDVRTHQTMESFQGRMDVLIDIQDGSSGAHALAPLSQQGDKDNDDDGRPTINLPLGQSPVILDLDSSLNPPLGSDGRSSDMAARTTSVQDDLPHTPLRRSSRPRKSTIPRNLTYLATISPDKDQASPLSSALRLSAQTRTSRKGKERAMSPSKCGTDMETEGRPAPCSSPFKLDEKLSNVKDQRRHSRSPARRPFTRELGSLSPNSTDLFTRLIPSTTAGTSEPEFLAVSTSARVETPPPDAPSNSLAAQTGWSSSSPSRATNSIIPDDITHFSGPVRIPATPRRPYTPNTPSKFRLQPIALDDPTRTPARRIPIEQAVIEGHISPQKFGQIQSGTLAPVGIYTGQVVPVLNMSLKSDSSPARRVFARPSTDGETLPRPKKTTEPQLSEPAVKQAHQMTPSRKAAMISRPAKLPFPLVAGPKAQTNPEKDAKKSDGTLFPSPAKSSLKQTSSRIPRKKPYSRPNATSIAAEHKIVTKTPTVRTVDSSASLTEASTSRKPPIISRTAPKAQNEALMTTGKRVIRAVDLSKSSTNKPNSLAPGSSSPDARSASGELNTKVSNAPAAGILKRKRLDSKVASVASSRSTALRQVAATATPPSTTTVAGSAASSSMRPSRSTSDTKTPAQGTQKPTITKFRRVVSPNPPASPHANHEETFGSTTVLPIETVEQQTLKNEGEESLPPREDMVLSSPVKETSPHSLSPKSPPTTILLPPSLPSQSSPTPLVFVMDPLSPVSAPAPLVENRNERAPAANGRRTTRLRKPTHAQPGINVFSSDPNATSNTTRPLQCRGPNATQNSRLSTDDVFSGMSMTALKTLTANNTVRNQQYIVANFETQIIRKEGARPESPIVKIKTIIQRQQEERARQREERAARRARRHGDTGVDGEEEENGDNMGYESPTSRDDLRETYSDHMVVKHRRGAGDDEDYETPWKNIDGEVNGKRRVKWDRGLYTEAFLDEVVLGTKVLAKENVATKGCLTATAKTLPLDTLGNLAELENPLLDLTQENVVVKKFVYDDDIEVVPPPATPLVRNTRSKSKKSKG